MRYSHFLPLSILLFASYVAAASAPTHYGFIPNKGQFIDQDGEPNHAVRYLLRTADMNVHLRAGGFSYEYFRSEDGDVAGMPDERFDAKSTVAVHRIDVEFEGASSEAEWEAYDAAPDVVNFFNAHTGPDGLLGVHHYRRLICRGIYPGIDIEFNTDGSGSVKYDLLVHEGGDPSRIRMRIAGAEVSVNGHSIHMKWDDGEMEDRIPRSYWRAQGKDRDASVTPIQIADDLVGFQVAGHEGVVPVGRTLVIDPVPQLMWGTYYGVADLSSEQVDVATDQQSNVFMAATVSVASMATWGAHDMVLSGVRDAFLVKLDAFGSRIWSTYYGGSDREKGQAVAVDQNGNIFLAGITHSTSGIATPFAHQTQLMQDWQGFLVKFTPLGSRAWGTYFGGGAMPTRMNMTVDGAGSPILAGDILSNGFATPGAADLTYDGTQDAFVIKFNSNGVRQWATYLGGTDYDEANSVSCDGTFIFVSGKTSAPNGIATTNGHDATPAPQGQYRAFLVKYSGLGQKLWGTYYGEGAFRSACVAELGTGNVYLVGTTTRTTGIASLFSHQPFLAGGSDGYLVKFNSSGVRQWGTYIGGAGDDRIEDIDRGSYGRYHISGSTNSTTGIATPNGQQPQLAGGMDAFLIGLSNSGSRLWGTYHGGAGDDEARSLSVNGLHCVIAGFTTSNSGIATPGAFQVNSGNGAYHDRFIARFNTPMIIMKSIDEVDDQFLVRTEEEFIRIELLVPLEENHSHTARLVDLQGRICTEQKLLDQEGTIRLHWNDAAAGVYVVMIEGATGTWSQRVVKAW